MFFSNDTKAIILFGTQLIYKSHLQRIKMNLSKIRYSKSESESRFRLPVRTIDPQLNRRSTGALDGTAVLKWMNTDLIAGCRSSMDNFLFLSAK